MKPIVEPLPRGVEFVTSEVHLIDHERREIHTAQGDLPYDFLICALGCRTAPEEIEGMADEMGRDVHTFYTLEGALAMREAIAGMTKAGSSSTSARCRSSARSRRSSSRFSPTTTSAQKGIRDRIEISLVTPYTGAFTKPNANRILSKVAEEKGSGRAEFRDPRSTPTSG